MCDGFIVYPAKNGSNGIRYYIFNSSYMRDSIVLDEGAQYQLVILANLVYKVSNTDSRNDQIVINFTGLQPDGVKAVKADARIASDKIYTVSGILMKGDKDRLPTGLYIIKGKKVMVRKN